MVTCDLNTHVEGVSFIESVQILGQPFHPLFAVVMNYVYVNKGCGYMSAAGTCISVSVVVLFIDLVLLSNYWGFTLILIYLLTTSSDFISY